MTYLWRTVVCFAAALVLAPVQASAQDVPPPRPGMGQVVFYRPNNIYGMLASCRVREGDTVVNSLPHGRYFIHQTTPGPHQYNVRGEARDSLRIEVEDGETQYIRCDMGSGVVMVRPNLSPGAAPISTNIAANFVSSRHSNTDMTIARLRNKARIAAAALALLAIGAPASAQEPATAAPAACCVIPAETPVEVELLEEIGSGHSMTGQMFPIRLAVPIVIDGRTLVPVGTAGMGEIVHAAPRRWVSRAPGELIIALRYLELDGIRIPLHRIGYSGSGRVGLNFMFISSGIIDFSPGYGRNLNIPVGTHLGGVTRGDVTIPVR